MKYLHAYILNGEILGKEKKSWRETELNDNLPFKITSNITETDYSNISTIRNWYDFGLLVVSDYLVVQRQIKSMIIDIGWSNLTNEEKDIAIELFAFDNNANAIIYLMSEKGLSQQDAMMFVLKHWHIHHGKMIECTRERWFQVKLIVGMFISTADAEDLFNTTKLLIYSYTESGILGKNYGDNTDGILDFIESTNGYVNNGLIEKDYDLNFANWFYFIESIKNVLVYGIYSKE